MRDEDALRFASGAGGIDEISEVERRSRRSGVMRRVKIDEVLVAIKVNDRDRVRGDGRRRVIGDEKGRRRVIKDEVKIVGGIRSIKREVSSASFDDSEDGDDEAERVREEDGNERVVGDAEREKVMSELIGERVELREGERGGFEGDGGEVREEIDLTVEDLIERRVRREERVGVVEVRENVMNFVKREER